MTANWRGHGRGNDEPFGCHCDRCGRRRRQLIAVGALPGRADGLSRHCLAHQRPDRRCAGLLHASRWIAGPLFWSPCRQSSTRGPMTRVTCGFHCRSTEALPANLSKRPLAPGLASPRGFRYCHCVWAEDRSNNPERRRVHGQRLSLPPWGDSLGFASSIVTFKSAMLAVLAKYPRRNDLRDQVMREVEFPIGRWRSNRATEALRLQQEM